MSVTLALVNEQFEPLSNVTVEAYNPYGGTIIQVGDTDKGGIVTLSDVTFPLSETLFRARIVRDSKAGGTNPATGKVYIQVLGGG